MFTECAQNSQDGGLHGAIEALHGFYAHQAPLQPPSLLSSPEPADTLFLSEGANPVSQESNHYILCIYFIIKYLHLVCYKIFQKLDRFFSIKDLSKHKRLFSHV